MHTTEQSPGAGLTSRLERLGSHLDAERVMWGDAITLQPDLEPGAPRRSRRPLVLAGAAMTTAAAAAALVLAPPGTDPSLAPPAASASPSTQAPTPAPVTTNPGQVAPIPAPVPLPTNGAPVTVAADDLPPDARPNPMTPQPCPPTPSDLVVPDVVGMTYQAAEAVLDDADFRTLIVGEPAPNVDEVIVAQHFDPPIITPCWNVVAVTFDSTIDLDT